MKRTIGNFVLLGFLLLLVPSCATSSGKSVERSAERDREEKNNSQQAQPAPNPPPSQPTHNNPPWPPEQPRNWEPAPPPPPPVRIGFDITSSPSGALVTIDGREVGTTPYQEDNPYRVTGSATVSKEGYKSQTFSFYSGGRSWKSYHLELKPLQGTLILGPEARSLLISTENGQILFPGANLLRVGSHVVTAYKFGFEDIFRSVIIEEDQTITLDLDLQDTPWVPSPLRPLGLDLQPEWSTGSRGVGFDYSVSAPGTGILEIRDAEGIILDTLNLGPFSQRAQTVVWKPGAAQLASLEPGVYTAILKIGDVQPMKRDFSLDYRMNPGTLGEFWSGTSGALFSPRASVPEPGEWALSTSFQAVSGNGYTQALVNSGVVAGVHENWEWNFSLASRIWDDPYLNSWYVTTGVKNRLYTSGQGTLGWYSGLSLSGFYDAYTMVPPTTDPFTNPAGMKAGVVATLGSGDIQFSLAPEAVWAWKGVSYLGNAVPGIMAYLRGALDIRTELAQFILSGALRTQTFSTGFGLQRPLQAGAEVRFPLGSGYGINLLSSLEWTARDDWALFLGAGFSLAAKDDREGQTRFLLPRK